MKKRKFDFGGWATRNNVLCSDGKTIMPNAFKQDDGSVVPLVWNHSHTSPEDVLGHALLENRSEGVYAYCTFNGTTAGQNAKHLVEHGDIRSLSIYANGLKKQGNNVMHGVIREVSLVLAGANPLAFIDDFVKHGGEIYDDEAILYIKDDKCMLSHSDDSANADDDDEKDKPDTNNKTNEDVFNTFNDEQKDLVYALIEQALQGEEDTPDNKGGEENDDEVKGGEKMKHNVFDKDSKDTANVLSHSDQTAILEMAKSSSVGSFRTAMAIYAEDNDSLAHGFESIESLFPDFKDVTPGAPELIQRDQGWVGSVLSKTRKSPISRIRTRQVDARDKKLRGRGYKKGDKKKEMDNVKLITRTTDPQTVYVHDRLHRDDVVDITDFDVVAYEYNIMKELLNEEVAVAVMIGDGRDDGDEHKIKEEHIRSIWNDDDVYTIHADVDITTAKSELQGTNTGVSFGKNYVYAEAIITAALYAREDYKGSGTPDFYCTPHLLNVMLLARDMNGRRIYDSRADLAAALNVGEIHTAEQFEGLVRTSKDNKEKKLLGIFVNLADYTIGATKGGEISQFNDFDIEFNQLRFLIETRLSGALTKPYSAIALEEPAESAAG